jgi:hypothetical protein
MWRAALWLAHGVKHLRPSPAGYSRIERFPEGTYQHNIPHISLDTGGGSYRDLLHLRPREARLRSTPSPAEEGAAEVFSTLGDKGIAIKAHYLSTPGVCELGPSIDVIEIRVHIVYRHCNLY